VKARGLVFVHPSGTRAFVCRAPGPGARAPRAYVDRPTRMPPLPFRA
jgi:hypothetical protein